MKYILGTSMWGWTIDQSTAFDLLDCYYKAGGRQIDTATNYPINKNAHDWRRSENILAKWINANGVNDLQIWVKVGSLDNQMSPRHNLQPSFLYLALDYYQNLFQSNLHTFGIHWDNRLDRGAIAESFLALEQVKQAGYQLGFSGVQRPDLYADLNQSYHFKFRIQLKNNILQSDYDRYPQFHPQHEFIAYGINAGGLKLQSNRYRTQSYLKTRGGDPTQIHPIIPQLQSILKTANQNTKRPPLTTFHEISLLYNYYQKGIDGVLLGASNPTQLANSLGFIKILQKFNYQDIYQKIISL